MLNFSLNLKQEPVCLTLEEGDKEQEQYFVMMELDGAERDSYLTEENKRFRIEEGKVIGVTGYEGHQTSLLSRVLAYGELAGTEADGETKKVKPVLNDKGDPKMVPASVIDTWPGRVQEGLHDAAEKMMGMGKYKKKAEKDAKND